MYNQPTYYSNNIRFGALIKADSEIKKSISEGNLLLNGKNALKINTIKNLSAQLGYDFKELSAAFKAGKINLQTYVTQLNKFVALLNSDITVDGDALGVQDIKKEYLRVRQLVEEKQPTPNDFTKSKIQNSIFSNKDLIKARIEACYGNSEILSNQALQKSIQGGSLSVRKQESRPVHNLMDDLNKTIDEGIKNIRGIINGSKPV